MQPSCAVSGNACHSVDGRKGGLFFEAPDQAFDLLSERVEPSDASCSEVMSRLESDDPGYQMPRGRKLPAAERCAIQKWIEGGALR